MHAHVYCYFSRCFLTIFRSLSLLARCLNLFTPHASAQYDPDRSARASCVSRVANQSPRATSTVPHSSMRPCPSRFAAIQIVRHQVACNEGSARRRCTIKSSSDCRVGHGTQKDDRRTDRLPTASAPTPPIRQSHGVDPSHRTPAKCAHRAASPSSRSRQDFPQHRSIDNPAYPYIPASKINLDRPVRQRRADLDRGKLHWLCRSSRLVLPAPRRQQIRTHPVPSRNLLHRSTRQPTIRYGSAPLLRRPLAARSRRCRLPATLD